MVLEGGWPLPGCWWVHAVAGSARWTHACLPRILHLTRVYVFHALYRRTPPPRAHSPTCPVALPAQFRRAPPHPSGAAGTFTHSLLHPFTTWFTYRVPLRPFTARLYLLPATGLPRTAGRHLPLLCFHAIVIPPFYTIPRFLLTPYAPLSPPPCYMV